MNVKKMREQRGLTQAELAQMAGIAPAVLSRVENNEVVPQARTLYKIKQALGEALNNGSPARSCRVEDLDLDEILISETAATLGWTDLARMTCKSRRNEPDMLPGDTLFFDKNQTDPRIEGYYLFKFPKGFATYYSVQDIQEGDRVYLSAKSLHWSGNMGMFDVSDLVVIGALVHIGRNIQIGPRTQ
jgi:transcriptional regulator with XRE-family HTH domain